MAIRKGSRKKTKARVAVSGPTNAGKTYSLLVMAYGIVKQTLTEKLGRTPTDEEIWDKIVLIDSERGRGEYYINRDDLPFPTGEYWYISIESPYTPQKYMDAVSDAYDQVGEDGVAIVDSFSHPWAYKGGVLDIKEKIVEDSKGKKNSYTAWAEAGDIQNSLIDVILSVPMHLLITMRSKMDYVLEENEHGKKVPILKGTKPIQRDDLEYEFDITLTIDKNHRFNVIKDVTYLGADPDKWYEPITPAFGENLVAWLNQGKDPAKIKEENRLALVAKIKQLCKDHPSLATYYKNITTVRPDNLSEEAGEDILSQLREFKSL